MENLIIKYLKGELSETEKDELMHWINTNESNKALFLEFKNAHIASNLIKSDAEIVNSKMAYELFKYRQQQKNPDRDLKNNNPDRKISVKWIWSAAAVILLLGLGILITYYSVRQDHQEYHEIITKRGEKTFLKMADGTSIWLNSETTLRYPVDLNTKKVEVYLSGEAYFNVAKNKGREFIVKTSDINIAVLGTSFNVKSYADEGMVETTLEEGRISITGKLGNARIKEPIILKPNQQATFIVQDKEYMISDISSDNDPVKNNTAPVSTTRKPLKKPQLVLNEKVDSELYTSWKDGMLTFKSEKLQDLAVKMERWYDVKIFIRNNDLKEVKYTGTFEKETVEQAFKALSLSFPFAYEINHDTIIVKKPSNNNMN